MALPAGLDTVTVAVGPYVDAEGAAASGTVTFTPSSRLLWSATGAVVLEGPVSVSLDALGVASVELPATDASGLNVSGFYYAVSWNLTAAGGRGIAIQPRAVQLPAAAPTVTLSLLVAAETGGTVDVDLPSVVSVAGLSGAVTAADLSAALAAELDADGLVTAAELTAGLATKASSTHTHAQSDVTGLAGALALLAPINGPAFTGAVTVPTASPGDNDTTAASTAFVTAAVAAAVETIDGGTP